MNNQIINKIKLGILNSNINELRTSTDKFTKSARVDSQLILMDLINHKEINHELAGTVFAIILGNLELFSVIYGSEKTIDFIKSRVQWLETDTEYTSEDLIKALLEIKVELINIKLGKESCVRLKSTFHLLNVLVSNLNNENLLK